jgi:hypothetical protein
MRFHDYQAMRNANYAVAGVLGDIRHKNRVGPD